MKRPSPAMIVATVALLVALSGGAYASVALNQVRSTHIKNGEVKTPDLANNAVTSAKIRDRSVRGADLAANTVGGGQVNEALLGKVPAAANADTLAGQPPAAFLSAGRILSGEANIPATGTLPVFTDPTTGVEVLANVNGTVLRNGNATAEIAFTGLMTREAGSVSHDGNLARIQGSLPAGLSSTFGLSTVNHSHFDVVITRVTETAASLRLTCSYVFYPTGPDRLRCIGITF